MDTQAGWLRMALPMWLLEKEEEVHHAGHAELQKLGSKRSLDKVTQTDDVGFMRNTRGLALCFDEGE